MTTTAIKDCPTCRHRKSAVSGNERAVQTLARKLTNAQNSDLAPHLQRGIFTQLEKAKATLATSKQMLDEHQYGECGS
jgi:argininosuccinate lyase